MTEDFADARRRSVPPDDSAAYKELEGEMRAARYLARRATITSCELHWQALITRLETTGYDFVLDEYKAEIGAREVIERAMEALPPDIARRLRDRVSPWDERYIAATVKAAHPFWSGGWWTERLPNRGSALYLESAEGVLP
jgi:hypothetical protein